MKNDILKTLAMRAKNRMINKTLRDTYSNANVKIISKNDEKFDQKVRELVRSGQDIHNPIKKLMDETKFMNLDERGRERYLFETIEKYNEIRNKMLAENGAC